MDEVSAQKPRIIKLLRDPRRGWYCSNVGWVETPHKASVVSDRMIELLQRVAPAGTTWEVVEFVEKPF